MRHIFILLAILPACEIYNSPSEFMSDVWTRDSTTSIWDLDTQDVQGEGVYIAGEAIVINDSPEITSMDQEAMFMKAMEIKDTFYSNECKLD